MSSFSGSCAHRLTTVWVSLNLVVVRTVLPYGPYINYLGMIPPLSCSALHSCHATLSAAIPFIAVAACYGYLKQTMKSLSVGSPTTK